MTRASPRTNFNSSRLIRFLADLSLADAAESKQAFAERLGEWLDFTDAITLHAAHNAGAANPAAAQGQQSGEPSAAAVSTVATEFERTRTALANSISKSCTPNAAESRLKLPTPNLGGANEGNEPAASYEPYHRFYVAHQRDMEASLRPLRANVRLALSRASPTLKQLAALDAALDKVLGLRERQLLATVPSLLEKRFAQLLQAHRQALLETGQADDAALWMQPGGWLANFGKELHGALLAELDLRLQPTMGLIEAFSNEANRHK